MPQPTPSVANNLLQCPLTKTVLTATPKGYLNHDAEQPLLYPVVDGLPILIVEKARSLSAEEWESIKREPIEEPASSQSDTSAAVTQTAHLALLLCAIGFFISFCNINGHPLLAEDTKEEVKVPLLKRYSFNDDHDPNGIGKFYMGREIARVMSFHGAPWLERPEREEEEKLSKLIELLNIKPGMNIADIGAGSGRISVLLAKETGKHGIVYAVDIQKEMITLIEKKMKSQNITNIKPVLCTEKSPKLETNSVDLAIFVDVYHELEFPYEVLLELSKVIKAGGRIALVEYRLEDPKIPIKTIHKMSEKQAKRELELKELGFKWIKTHDELPRQHVLVFERLKKE